MKNKNIFLLTILILLTQICHADEDCIHDENNFNCVTYLKNYDADTITVEISNVHPLLGHKISVRVYGIDTPEIKGRSDCEKNLAHKAKIFVQNALSNAKRIDLRNVQRDKYFRILSEVIFDNKSLADLLLKKGYAYSYYGKTKQEINWCNQLHSEDSGDL